MGVPSPLHKNLLQIGMAVQDFAAVFSRWGLRGEQHHRLREEKVPENIILKIFADLFPRAYFFGNG
jgi:hypothetical protein